MLTYFIPSPMNTLTADIRARIPWLLDAEELPVTREVTKGPSGGPGLLFTAPGGTPESGGTWKQIDERGAWVAWPDTPPEAMTLARPNMIQGHVIKISGQLWMVPVARAFDVANEEWRCNLPTEYEFHAGVWSRDTVLDRHRALWDLSAVAWDQVFTPEAIIDPDTGTIRVDLNLEAVDIAVTSLSANYRIGAPEISLLRMITDESVRDIVFAIIDIPTFREAMRKKTDGYSVAAGSSGEPGAVV